MRTKFQNGWQRFRLLRWFAPFHRLNHDAKNSPKSLSSLLAKPKFSLRKDRACSKCLNEVLLAPSAKKFCRDVEEIARVMSLCA
ncbi:hypothetical protein VIGAN_05148200 [Vigna angularis var. angularis]|uniref:Uncharacterized protein n=1 Tax=Vigna angularis var. angularis TaxID=157739 RepID=A0A0S3S5I8_PHAAN|nr:hypothetical protein VIGAN_05148200 [Vigna angularis var. angularis]